MSGSAGSTARAERLELPVALASAGYGWVALPQLTKDSGALDKD